MSTSPEQKPTRKVTPEQLAKSLLRRTRPYEKPKKAAKARTR